MNAKRILTILIASVLFMEVLFLFSIPIVKASGVIPDEYSQDLDLDGIYVYNVTDFGDTSNWLNFTDDSLGNWSTNAGGQVIVNFTGFFDRDPNDIVGDALPDTNMSWMEIQIFKDTGTLQLNLTISNASNSEVAREMALKYMGFASGILIPIDDLDGLKTMANSEAIGTDLTIDETHNFISFNFEQNTGDQSTLLVYDKFTGLLIQASTKIISTNYQLDMFLINYSMDLDKIYHYNVTKYGGPLIWSDFNWQYVGLMMSNPGGYIEINFTGYYDKPANDILSDVFTDPNLKRAFMNMEVYYKGDFGDVLAFDYKNASNREYANNMLLGYMNFLSGFLIPDMSNISFIKEKALEQSDVWGNEADITIKETDLSIKFIIDQKVSGMPGGTLQYTEIIYEKISGLLLYVDTKFDEFELEMNLESYIPWKESTKDKEESEPIDETIINILSFPLVIVIGIIGISSLIYALRKKNKIK